MYEKSEERRKIIFSRISQLRNLGKIHNRSETKKKLSQREIKQNSRSDPDGFQCLN